MSKREEILIKAIHECYVELFANSEPKGDFEKMLEEATFNDRGEKEIPFMDYEIYESKFKLILNDVCKKYNIKGTKPLSDKRRFENTIYLGCSPKFKNQEDGRL